MANRWRNNGNRDFIFLGSKITVDGDCSNEMKMVAPWKKSYDKTRPHVKKQRHHFANRSPCSQSYDFPSSHVWMWDLDHEDWALKNWCFQIAVLEKTLEILSGCRDIKLVNLKGNKPWIFTGRTDAEAPILWPTDANSWLIWKDPDAGKDWGQEEKGTTKDKMVRQHHWLNRYKFG